MSCEDVFAALAPFHACAETADGACVMTHCLYPSFDPVRVYVSRSDEGFRVHDGGGAERAAWLHGRDDHLIRRVLTRQAERYQIRVSEGVLLAEPKSQSWLTPAILSVANASSSAAHAIVERAAAAAERDLTDRVYAVLSRIVSKSELAREAPVVGQSGKEHRFDFVVRRRGRLPLLIDTVTPHHVSIAAKYMAFADVSAVGDGQDRFAVFERSLAPDDASLMRQVADLVPFASLDAGARRALLQ